MEGTTQTRQTSPWKRSVTLGEATSLFEPHAAPVASTYRSSRNILMAFVSAVTGAHDDMAMSS